MTDEERFETLLGRYRGAAVMPDFRAVRQEPREPRRWTYAVAAAIVIAIGIGVFLTSQTRTVTLSNGDIVETKRSWIRINAPSIGTIDVSPFTTLQLVESRAGRYRLDLQKGTIHARTTSPPGVFIVNTPRANAIDLGCEYTLFVAPSGMGYLRVTAGWVNLQYGFTQSLVPAGASADIDADGNLSAAVFADSSPQFQSAATAFAMDKDDTSLDTILRTARTKDAFTLLNLFPRAANSDQRVRIYDRLNALVPAPSTISRDAVRDEWTIGTTEAWWPSVLKASGVTAIKKKRLSS